MEMWLKQATLAVLTVAAAAMAISSQTSVFLNSEEERVEVPAGSTLTLYCCLETYDRSWMYWHFTPSGNSSHSTEISRKVISKSAGSSVVDCRDSEKMHSLLGVNETNSGLYFCNVSVDIPHPKKNQSEIKEVVITSNIVESTTSLVTSKQVPSSDPPLQFKWWMWVLVGVSPFILVVLAVVCILLRKCPSRNRAADPIYANTHSNSKQPSPRPPMNQLKTVSSSQNLRTPSPGQRYGEGKRRPRH